MWFRSVEPRPPGARPAIPTGLVALTVGCLVIRAYMGRDLMGGPGIALAVDAVMCLVGLDSASTEGHEHPATTFVVATARTHASAETGSSGRLATTPTARLTRDTHERARHDARRPRARHRRGPADGARELHGQATGLVAVAVGFPALGAYLGRDLSGATGLVLVIGAFAVILNVAVANRREPLAAPHRGLRLAIGIRV